MTKIDALEDLVFRGVCGGKRVDLPLPRERWVDLIQAHGEDAAMSAQRALFDRAMGRIVARPRTVRRRTTAPPPDASA